MTAQLLDDPITPLLEAAKDTATILPDPVNGYDRIIPTAETLEEMGRLYAREIREADTAYEPIFARMIEDGKAYDADVTDQDKTITYPLAKRIVNQQVSWLSTAILSKTPIITIKPIDGGSYEIPAAITGEETPPESPFSQPVFETTTVSSEEAAALLQAFLQFKLTTSLDFEQIVEDTVLSIHSGENPTYWRIDYDPRVRRARMRDRIETPRGVQFFGVVDTEIVPRDIVTIRHVPGQNITMTLAAEDVQSAWWVAEKKRPTNLQLWEEIKAGRYDFCRKKPINTANADDLDLISKVIGGGDNYSHDEMARSMAEVDKRIADQPQLTHDVRTVMFFHPFRVGGNIEVRSCIGDFHVKSETWLNMMVNWSFTGKRLLVPFFQRKRPHRFSGMSSAGDIAPIQRLISSILHLQIQNAVQQNVKVFLIRENSRTWNFLTKSGNQLRPGLKIPFEDPDDINPVQLGSPVQSMAQEITFLNAEAERLSAIGDFDLGIQIPGRTPAATVAQIQELAKMQPASILRAVRRSISKAIEMYLQTVAQFRAYETIPFLDPEKKEIVSKLIGFPREIIANHFSFQVTATGDEDTAAAKFEKAGILITDTDAANDAALKAMMVILDPNSLPAAKRFAAFCLRRRERLYAEKIRSYRLDTQHFEITDAMIDELIAAVEQQVPAQPQPTQEGAPPNGQSNVPPAVPGGPVPAVPPGEGGSEPLPGQPGNEGVPQPAPPPDLLGNGEGVV
jgi:hypothetical protein